MSQVGVFPASFPDDSLVAIPSNDVNIYPELGQVTPRLHTQVDPDEAVILARGRRIIPAAFSPDRNRDTPVRKYNTYIDLCPLSENDFIAEMNESFFWDESEYYS